jgi:hypothetical protein
MRTDRRDRIGWKAAVGLAPIALLGCASTGSSPRWSAPGDSPAERQASGPIERAIESAPREPDAEIPHEEPHRSIPGFFDTHFSGTAWSESVWRDYLTQPPVLLPLGLAVAAAAVSRWDKPLQERFAGRMGTQNRVADGAEYALLSGAVLSGILFPGPDRSSWDETWNSVEALGLTAGITSVIKRTARRQRPSGGDFSFPSGHTSSAFASATLIDLNSGIYGGIPAYALATATGLSRVDTGAHYPSDVLAGAAIGTLVAGIFDALHFGTGREGRGICAPPPVRMDVQWEPGTGFEACLEFRF